MFEDILPEDRLRLLIDNCDNREEGPYMKELNAEELDFKRESITENYITLNDLDEDLAKVKQDFKKKTDPLKLKNKALLKEVKTRKEERKGWLFSFFNLEEGIVNIYDEKGEFISSRRLDPLERVKQAKLFIAHPKAVNE